jgi:HD-like signal output (HDOD) protein
MSIVHTDNIRERMVLSAEVKDVKGRLLLKKGQKIESNHIRILKMWGITEVNVVGDASGDEDTETTIDKELIEKVTEDTRRDFVHVDLDHPAISELFRLTVLFRSSQGISKKENIPVPDEYENSAADLKPDVRNKIMQQEVKLPEIPSIVFELNEIMANPLSSADDIAQIVSKSPSLATVLLKIVNSSFYGFPSKIDSISRAVTMIGTREIGSLALGISVITLFEGLPKELIDMHGFLRHGFACGIISRILAAQKNLPQTEQLFVSGLLHDIGRAIVYQYFPGHANVLLYRSLESGRLLYQEERECLGCRHTDIGRYLLQKWKLPFNLENNVACHHNPSTANDPVQAAIVQMADIISNALGLGTSGERFVPNFDHEAWDSLGLSPSCIDVVIRQGVNQLTSLSTFCSRMANSSKNILQ